MQTVFANLAWYDTQPYNRRSLKNPQKLLLKQTQYTRRDSYETKCSVMTCMHDAAFEESPGAKAFQEALQ